MDSSDEEQPLFQKNTLLTPSDHDGYDSEDDFGLSSMADHDQYDNLNIPSNMKDILRMGNHDMGTTNLQDDSDSDTDSSLYQSRPFQITVDINKLNIELAKNKFHNFPLMPGQEEQNETTTKKAKKPREKKKRRDKGKKNADILEARQQARSNNLDSLMKRFEQEASEESANEDEKIKKKKGRQTRKQKSNEPQFDENGELLIRSTELLDESSSEEETEKKLSKKQELEMYRENERLRRATKISLKPVYNIKSFDDLVRRQDEREEEYMRKMALAKKQSTTTPAASTKVDSSDDGSDIEIIGDPKKIAAALMSPERARIPVPNWSPVRHATTSLRNHNRSMLSRITNEGYAYRIKMEEQAKARGQYASATERARQLLQKEKDALLINQQINQHFEKNKQNQHDDEDEEDDEDYQEDEEDDGFMNEYSGSSEEEFAIEDVDDRKDAYKRKLGHKEEGEEEEEEDDDMATMAFKRWKGKKIKKSIFDDDDDDDDDEAELAKKKATSQKPVPKHSISNFFKAKEAEAITKETEAQSEDKPLSRLVRRENKVISDDEDELETVAPQKEADSVDEDAMDIDEPIPVRKLPKPKLVGPREKNEYLEEEAEEEDDEYFGAGGSDGEHGENLDEYEKDDLLVEESNEHIDEAALREAFNKQDRESDSNMIQRLMTDITGGGLRKQKAAAEAGLMLDDIDLFNDEDNDLIAIRRAAAARRRKLLKKKGGDILDNLMSDPKTAAFAKAAQAIPDEAPIVFLSDSEAEDDNEEEQQETNSRVHTKFVIQEEEDEEEDDLMGEASDEDNILIVDEFDTMNSPMRGGLVSNMNITSAADEDEGFQVETMISPINARRTKPIFGSPSNMQRFKRLIAETSSALNGASDSGGPRVGFGALPRKSDGPSAEKENPRTFGSIGELLNKNNNKNDGPPKVSKLKKLSKTKDVFQYGL